MSTLSPDQRIEIGRLIAVIALAARRQITAVKEGNEGALKFWLGREQEAVEKLNDKYGVYPQNGCPTDWVRDFSEVTS